MVSKALKYSHKKGRVDRRTSVQKKEKFPAKKQFSSKLEHIASSEEQQFIGTAGKRNKLTVTFESDQQMRTRYTYQ